MADEWPPHDNIIIAPTLADAEVLASWLRGNEVRGIWDTDNTLVLFDSYRNTHDSVRRALGLRHLNGDCIVQKDGNIHTGGLSLGKKFRLEKHLTDAECALFRKIASLVGNPDPYLTGYE